jgi:TonB family protein
MAPILKDIDAPAATTTASNPANPQTKSPNDTPTRPQPVALEIPVTVNGARTVDGSDKRVPFSESTQTVLIFSHGAVIRIATPLVSGQLVFLTNEKTKKEVVCQVVKSKATGSTGAYVELQFTEPSLSFWGLQIPGASSAPVAPRPLAPAPAAPPKAAATTTPIATKPPIAPKPVAPAAISAPPAKPIAPPPAAPVIPATPVVAHSESVTPTVPPAPVVAPPPPPIAAAPLIVAEPEVPAVHVKVPPPSAPPIHDYAKEISDLFAVPQAPSPVAQQAQVTSSSNQSSTEDLKLQAARLQSQLSSLLFTETGAPAAAKPDSEVAKKVLEIAQQEAKPAIKSSPAVVPQVRKPASTSLGADEEVKIPSWLAPLSQNAESATSDSPASSEASSDHAASVNSEESFDALVASDASHRPQAAVFGGQLLGESSSMASESASTGSKKGLILGLIAATALLAGGGWYFYQNHSASSSTVATHSSNPAMSAAPAPVSNVPSNPVPSASAANNAEPSSTSASQASKNSSAAPTQAVANLSTTQPKSSGSAAKTTETVQPEIAPKPTLGDVHLAAPVVNRSGGSSQEGGDSLQAIDTKAVPSGADPFSTAVAIHNAPAAPLPVGGDVKSAQLLKSVPPEYPAIAKAQHISGKVEIDALIDASGNVASVKVQSGPALLHRAALEAVKQWKYKPAMLDGEPTSMHLIVTVEFRGR